MSFVANNVRGEKNRKRRNGIFERNERERRSWKTRRCYSSNQSTSPLFPIFPLARVDIFQGYWLGEARAKYRPALYIALHNFSFEHAFITCFLWNSFQPTCRPSLVTWPVSEPRGKKNFEQKKRWFFPPPFEKKIRSIHFFLDSQKR